MNKVLITGASGLLGRALVLEFSKHSWEVCGLAFSRAKDKLIKVDLNNIEEVKQIVQTFKPDVIVHSAAERSPDKVEKEYEDSKKLNVECSRNLASMAVEMNIAFIYISTDYVFDGANPPYTETDKTNPLNKYGLLKLEGEKAVLESYPGACVLRIPVLYGVEEYLGESAISCLIKNLQQQAPVKISNFEIRYPSHADDIAAVCCQLATKKLKKETSTFIRSKNQPVKHVERTPTLVFTPDEGRGFLPKRSLRQKKCMVYVDPSVKSIFHWCGSEPLTKFEMGKIIAEVFDIPYSHVSPDNEPSTGAPRPKNTQLSCEKLKALGVGQHTPFKEGVKRSFKIFFE